MFHQIAIFAEGLSGIEQVSLAAVVAGVAGLIAARMLGGSDPITRRAYAKPYSGAPGANLEDKPDQT
jgi:hypothetical protein